MKTHNLLLALPLLFLAACHTTKPETSRFAKADVSGDGKLSLAEASDYMVLEVFTARDANGDKQMTAAEWNPVNDAFSAKTFRSRDTNMDGFVTLKEATDYAAKHGSFKKPFQEADVNKDNFINADEAHAYAGSKEGPMR